MNSEEVKHRVFERVINNKRLSRYFEVPEEIHAIFIRYMNVLLHKLLTNSSSGRAKGAPLSKGCIKQFDL